MTRHGMMILTVLVILLTVRTAGAQALVNGIARPTVYIADVRQNVELSELGILSDFARRFISLRFASSGKFVVSQQTDPQCTAAASSPYLVRGSINVNEKANRSALLTYELVKLANCEAKTIVRQSFEFTSEDALDYLSLMASEVAKAAEADAYVKTTVAVDVFTDSGDQFHKDLVAGIAGSVVTRLNRESDLEAQLAGTTAGSPPALAIKIEVKTPRRIPVLSTVQGAVQGVFRAGDKRLPATIKVSQGARSHDAEAPLVLDIKDEQDADAINGFYRNIAEAAVKELNEFRFNAVPSTSPAPETFQAILAQARQILCVDQQASQCVPQSKGALTLLDTVPAQGDKNKEWLELRAKAQSDSRDFTAAAVTYERLIKEDPANAARHHSEAGSAWYEAQDYISAEPHLKEALASEPSRLDLVLKYSRSIRLQNRFQDAFTALLQASDRISNSPELDREFSDLVAAMSAEEARNASVLLAAKAANAGGESLSAGSLYDKLSLVRKQAVDVPGAIEAASRAVLIYTLKLGDDDPRTIAMNERLDGLRNIKSQASPQRLLSVTPGNTAEPLRTGWWSWTVFIGGDPGVLDQIECVEYTLHPTFPQPVLKVCDRGAPERGFPLTTSGWGTFQIHIRLLRKDKQVQELSHYLVF